MDLRPWLDKPIEALSKGMAQKVQFIAAVVAEPDLLILDEPFSGLDPVNAEVLKDAVFDVRRAGTTVVFSTHDMGVAERMCDRIFMIYKGKKVLDGTLDQIQAAYGADTVRVRVDGGAAVLRALPGVTSVNDYGQLQEVRCTDPQALLAALVARARVQHFEITRPSLHDIFVRIARPSAVELAQEATACVRSSRLRPRNSSRRSAPRVSGSASCSCRCCLAARSPCRRSWTSKSTPSRASSRSSTTPASCCRVLMASVEAWNRGERDLGPAETAGPKFQVEAVTPGSRDREAVRLELSRPRAAGRAVCLCRAAHGAAGARHVREDPLLLLGARLWRAARTGCTAR